MVVCVYNLQRGNQERDCCSTLLFTKVKGSGELPLTVLMVLEITKLFHAFDIYGRQDP